jgi:hypothetical protein
MAGITVGVTNMRGGVAAGARGRPARADGEGVAHEEEQLGRAVLERLHAAREDAIVKPTIGRIVRFTGNAGNATGCTFAALITYVEGDRANLCVFAQHGLGARPFEFLLAVPFSDTPQPGHWSWPPRSD